MFRTICTNLRVETYQNGHLTGHYSFPSKGGKLVSKLTLIGQATMAKEALGSWARSLNIQFFDL